ncbi:MAG: T9SS type A sorting domain-containing protein, partial [Taibaiella sp.]|nr:T9SS type A sorting domain-containing protein [Taibaiella sp.]
VLGYYVYRATSEFGNFQRISGMTAGTTFSDTVGTDGLKFYMVRPVKLQTTPSGGYYNLGLGITDTATVSYPHLAVAQAPVALSCNIYPNPATDIVNMTLDAATACTATITLINAAGAQYSTSVKELQSGANKLSLNVGRYPAGIYTIQVTSGQTTIINKIVKL